MIAQLPVLIILNQIKKHLFKKGFNQSKIQSLFFFGKTPHLKLICNLFFKEIFESLELTGNKGGIVLLKDWINQDGFVFKPDVTIW